VIVVAEGVRRTFRVPVARPGLLGGLRGLLTRDATTVEAVADVSFAVAPGEFVGVVGPNGAGKSTTLKMLTGILVPTGGRVEVCGVVPHRERTRLARRLGVVFGQRTQLWWDLSAAEGFDLLRVVYDVDRAVHGRRLAELTERLGLAELLDVQVRRMSLGQKMRCELAAALLHEPDLVLLDEPTIGLDVVAKEALRDFLRDQNARGTTLLLTSHDLDDIEQLCRRVLVIDRGRVLHDGDLASLRRRAGTHRRLELWLRAAPAGPLALPDGASVVEQDGRRVRVAFDGERLAAPELVRAVLRDHDVVDLAVHEARIEDVIRELYQR
jgi:ABC-2 type transport system ATP-binding protein